MSGAASRQRSVKGGLGLLVLLALLAPPSHLGDTSSIPESRSFKAAIFTSTASKPGGYERIIEVDIRELLLVLREQSGAEIRRYRIAGPRPKDIPKPLVKTGELFGNVDHIIIDPWWLPTPEIRQEWQAKGRELSERIAPGDPLNAMGKAKIVIRFEDYPEPLRIHGTNQPRSIGRHASRGCIRMHNRDILDLAQLVRGKKSLVLIRYSPLDGKEPA
jgi:lipoprotein-anchoring transpeptidase ErfK/SrfK